MINFIIISTTSIQSKWHHVPMFVIFFGQQKKAYKKHTPKVLRQLIYDSPIRHARISSLIVQIWQLTSIFTGVFIRGRVFTGSLSIDAQNRSMDYRSIKRGQSAGILSLCDDSDTRRPPSDSHRHKQPMVHAICFLHQTHGTARFA